LNILKAKPETLLFQILIIAEEFKKRKKEYKEYEVLFIKINIKPFQISLFLVISQLREERSMKKKGFK